jgi:thiamine biosynthesis protein ThiC
LISKNVNKLTKSTRKPNIVAAVLSYIKDNLKNWNDLLFQNLNKNRRNQEKREKIQKNTKKTTMFGRCSSIILVSNLITRRDTASLNPLSLMEFLLEFHYNCKSTLGKKEKKKRWN